MKIKKDVKPIACDLSEKEARQFQRIRKRNMQEKTHAIKNKKGKYDIYHTD